MYGISTTFIWIFSFAIGSAIVNTLGIFAIFKFREWAKKTTTYLMCFAAGILVSVPLMFSLPQAIGKNFYAGFAALGGFLIIFFSNQLIKNKRYFPDNSISSIVEKSIT